MINKKLLVVGAGVVIFLVIVSIGVHYQNAPREQWVFVSEDTEQKCFVDEKSIKAQAGIVEFRMRMDDKNSNSKYSHSISAVKMKLGDGTRFYVAQGEVYYKDGKISTQTMNRWIPISPYSSMASIYKFVSQRVQN